MTFLDDSQIRQAEAELEPISANIIPVHHERAPIPVHISQFRPKVNCNLEDRPPVSYADSLSDICQLDGNTTLKDYSTD